MWQGALIFLFLVSTGCSSRGSSTQTTATIIQPGSATALALSLSPEDISILHLRNPIVLKKIDKIKSLTLEEIISIYEAGITADSMILILERTQTRIILNTSDVIRLQTEGIPFKVINHMIRT